MVRFPGRSAFFLLSLLLVVPFLLFGLSGCSDSSSPGTDTGDGSQQFDGSIDPAGGTFVLQSLEQPVPGDNPIRVELIGRNLQVYPPLGAISLEIAVRNADSRTLYSPAEIQAFGFKPETVFPSNSDRTECPPDSLPIFRIAPGACTFFYSYSDLLGSDGMLAPGETSGFRTWNFNDPNLVAFSFGAAARFALNGDQARIAGLFFSDDNENGVPDPDESPLGGGWVEVQGPGIEGLTVPINEQGRYSVPVAEPGSYILNAVPPPTFGFAPVRFTTPNPLQVVLPPGPGGGPQSYLRADFGITSTPLPVAPPVILLPAPGDSVTTDSYHYLGGSLEGVVLSLRVGYSGCGPDQPFQLFMVGGFMESAPVQARLILSHDDLGQLCDAYFERTLRFDLTPVLNAYHEAYGPGGVVRLRFEDAQGQVHTFDLGV